MAIQPPIGAPRSTSPRGRLPRTRRSRPLQRQPPSAVAGDGTTPPAALDLSLEGGRVNGRADFMSVRFVSLNLSRADIGEGAGGERDAQWPALDSRSGGKARRRMSWDVVESVGPPRYRKPTSLANGRRYSQRLNNTPTHGPSASQCARTRSDRSGIFWFAGGLREWCSCCWYTDSHVTTARQCLGQLQPVLGGVRLLVRARNQGEIVKTYRSRRSAMIRPCRTRC